MQFDPAALGALLALPDVQLWETVKTIARANGITLPAATPPPAEMQKLRSIFSSGEGLTPEKAKRIIDDYKKGIK